MPVAQLTREGQKQTPETSDWQERDVAICLALAVPRCPWAGPTKFSVAVSALVLSARLPFTSPFTVSGPVSKGLGWACQGVVITSHTCACQGTQMEDSGWNP